MPDLPSPTPPRDRKRLRQLAERGAERATSLSTDEVAELCIGLIAIDDEQQDTILGRRWTVEN